MYRDLRDHPAVLGGRSTDRSRATSRPARLADRPDGGLCPWLYETLAGGGSRGRPPARPEPHPPAARRSGSRPAAAAPTTTPTSGTKKMYDAARPASPAATRPNQSDQARAVPTTPAKASARTNCGDQVMSGPSTISPTTVSSAPPSRNGSATAHHTSIRPSVDLNTIVPNAQASALATASATPAGETCPANAPPLTTTMPANPVTRPRILGRGHRLTEQPPRQEADQHRLQVDQDGRQPRRQEPDGCGLEAEEEQHVERREQDVVTPLSDQLRTSGPAPGEHRHDRSTEKGAQAREQDRRRGLEPDLDRCEGGTPRQDQQHDRGAFVRSGPACRIPDADQPGVCSHGSLRSRKAGSPMVSESISFMISCISGDGSFCSPFRASSSEVK